MISYTGVYLLPHLFLSSVVGPCPEVEVSYRSDLIVVSLKVTTVDTSFGPLEVFLTFRGSLARFFITFIVYLTVMQLEHLLA